MSEPDSTPGGTQARLLEAITNLAAFHRDHEKYYASAPREQAVALQRHSRVLLALADRWTAPGDRPPATRAPLSPFEGAPDLNADVALQLEGVLFMEGEGEPAEITRLKRDLRAASEACIETGDWLAAAMESSWAVASELLAIADLADLLGDRHRIIANDWQAADMSRLAGRALARAVDILDRVDFTPAGLRDDIGNARVAPRLLYSASEVIAHAADLLSDSAGLVHGNERLWRVFRARVTTLVERTDR